MKIGLFFGSFNPIHTGHLILAEIALNETALDYIWFVVSPQNPLKQKNNLLSEVDRLRMVELAVEDNDRLRASNIEFFLPKPSYTIDTLVHLNDKYRNYDFAIIMGQDNLQHFHKWKKHETILKYYPIYVYPRSEVKPSEYDRHDQIHFFDAPLLNISATYIRRCVKSGLSIRYLVPDAVNEYISLRGIYR